MAVTPLSKSSVDSSFDAETNHDALRDIRLALICIVIIATVTAFYFARDFLMPIVLSLILALTFSPLVRALSRVGVPAFLSAIIIVLGLLGLTLTSMYVLALPISEWFNRMPEMGSALRIKLSGLIAPAQALMDAQDEVNNVTRAITEDAPAVTIKGPGMFAIAASNLFGMATTLAVVLVLLTFLLATGESLYSRLLRSFDTLSDKKEALSTARDIERVISRYLLTITTINCALGIAVGVAMHALGMPTPYVWGAMAALLNFMPYIGALMGLVITSAVALITFDTIGATLTVTLVYLTLTVIEGQFLTPWIVGNRLQTNPAIVFISVGFWAWLWGIVGALIAVPVLVIFKALLENQTLRARLSARQVELD